MYSKKNMILKSLKKLQLKKVFKTLYIIIIDTCVDFFEVISFQNA